jgi:hypothetical protein
MLKDPNPTFRPNPKLLTISGKEFRGERKNIEKKKSAKMRLMTGPVAEIIKVALSSSTVLRVKGEY